MSNMSAVTATGRTWVASKGCDEQIGPVSLCSLVVVPGTNKCQHHTCCSWCGLNFDVLCEYKAYDRKTGEPVEGTYCSVKCAVATQNDLDGY